MPIWAFPLKWDGLSRPDWIREGTPVINQWRLGAALTGELEHKVNSLFVYNSNPVVVVPEQDKVLQGLAREDLFTVVSEHFITDTARYADIVLPATTQLEQFDIMFSWGHLYLTLNEPAVAPLGESVPNTEMFRRLARAMGFNDPYWDRTDEQMALDAMDWSNPVLEGIDLDGLRKTGYARLNVGSPEEFVPHREGNFPTPSGKVEFKSSIAEGVGNMVLPLFRQGHPGDQSGEALDPLPNFIPQNESPAHQPRTGGALSAQHALAEGARLPQLVLRQHGDPAAPRRRADGHDQSGRRGRARHRRWRRGAGPQRPGHLRGDGAGERGREPRRRGGAARLLGQEQPERPHGERHQPAGLRRLRQRADLLRHPGRGERGLGRIRFTGNALATHGSRPTAGLARDARGAHRGPSSRLRRMKASRLSK